MDKPSQADLLVANVNVDMARIELVADAIYVSEHWRQYKEALQRDTTTAPHPLLFDALERLQGRCDTYRRAEHTLGEITRHRNSA